jgi:hypothetical protein
MTRAIFGLWAAVVVGLGTIGAAESPASKAAVASKPKQRPFHGTIKAVNKSSKAIVLNGKKSQTFFIISETKIKKNGKPATLDQIVAGDSLGGYARQAADGRWEALTLNVEMKNTEASTAAGTAPGKAKPAK